MQRLGLLLTMVWICFSCRTVGTSSLLDDVDPGLYPACRASTCLHGVANAEQFASLAGQVETGGVTQSIVKVVYRRDRSRRDGTPYFINTRTYPYHYDFVRPGLGLTIPLRTFNQNYSGTGAERDFVLASLIHFPGEEDGLPEMMLLELWSGDTVQAPYLIELHQKIRERMGWDIPLVYHPLSAGQEALIPALAAAQIQTITTRELFQNKNFIALNKGEAVGYLKFVRNGQEGECLDHASIVVFDQVPNEIGLHAGVVTSMFQTPLSHVNVKSINRGTINMVLRDAHSLLAAYEGKPVKLRVDGTGYHIEELDAADADRQITAFWDAKRPSQPMTPTFSDQGPGFTQFTQMFAGLRTNRALAERHAELSLRYGAKATNIGLIHRVLEPLQGGSEGPALDVHAPDGYGMHFRFFDLFMNHRQTGLDPANPDRETTPNELIGEILAASNLLDGTVLHSICQAKPHLARIRGIIEAAAVPDAIIDEFQRLVMEDERSPIHISKIARLRLRSSTNSEDLPGFNGAGLYNSAGVHYYKRDDDDRYLADEPRTWDKILNGGKGIKARLAHIYSSVWNDRAFEEREWFRMNGQNHLQVKVGVALHNAFPRYDLEGPGEYANGVATSTNIYAEEEYDRIYINGQHYDLAVTNPPLPEELAEYNEDPNAPYATEEMIVTPLVADEEESGQSDVWKGWTFEVISRSSVAGGADVLQDDGRSRTDPSQMEVRRLAKVMEHLDLTIAPVYGLRPENFVVDVEWKIFGNGRKLWIKQARPLDQGNDRTAADASPLGLVDTGRVPLTPLGPRF